MDSCVFCNQEFQEYVIKKYSHWEIQLFRDDQYYIGRTVVVLRERHIKDLTQLTKTERNELFETVLPELRNTLLSLFNPNNFNYTSLGDDCPHLHFHVIPRYNHTVKFNGRTFEDEYWNQTHSQSTEKIQLNQNELDLLKTKIQNTISEN